jgi:protein ImuB
MDIKHGQPCLQGKPLLLGKQIERISSGWWDKNPVKRDYYLASNNQLRAWIFRDLGSGQWYLHGIF